MSFTVRETCRLCDAKLPDERVLDLGYTALANALLSADAVKQFELYPGHADYGVQEFTAPLYLVQCSACGHVQLPVVVDPKLLFTRDYAYRSGTSPVFRAHLHAVAREAAPGLIGDQQALAVDIGSNDGALLEELQNVGHFRAIGVDPAYGLAEEASVKGFLTLPYAFSRALGQTMRFSLGRAHTVTALNVFAHVADLHDFAEGVRELLDPKHGRFIFEVAHLPSMLKAGTFDLVYAEHQDFHHVTPLVRFFERHGLCLFNAYKVDSQGGSIRCYVAPEKHQPGAGLRAILEEERTTCSPAALADFRERVGVGRTKFVAGMQALKAQGKRIAAFGCPAKATTLLHYYGLGRETFDYIVEENPSKIGKFSPGKHLSIVAPEHFDASPVDVMVCLAWNFADNIRARYAHWPVEWVVPFAS